LSGRSQTSPAYVYGNSGVQGGDEYGALVQMVLTGENRISRYAEKNLSQCQFVRFLSVYVGFSFSVSFHQCPIINVILILPLSEGAADESWEPLKNSVLFGYWGELYRKIFSHAAFNALIIYLSHYIHWLLVVIGVFFQTLVMCIVLSK
jgi:hypothetical protein